MTRTETTPVSDADFNALVAQAVAAGERLFYTVQTPERRAYLFGLLAGDNTAEIHLADFSALQAQIDAANNKAAAAIAAKAQAEQKAQDAASAIPALQRQINGLSAQVGSLSDQLAQAKQALADANAANAQLQAQAATVTSQLSGSQKLARIVQELRGQ